MVMDPFVHYSRCLRRLDSVQELHSEATYHTTTPKTVTDSSARLLEEAKKDMSEALIAMNEWILKGSP